MRITLISALYDPATGGGAAAVPHDLAAELARQGHEVSVITGDRKTGVSYDGAVKVVRFHPLNLFTLAEKDRQPAWKRAVFQLIDLWNPQVHRAVRALLTDLRPDVVHVHKLRGMSPAVWSAARTAGVPRLVHTLHDYEIMSPDGLLRGRVGDWAEQGALPVRMYQSVRRRLSAYVDAVTCPSRFTLEAHTRLGFFPTAQQAVIPNTHGYRRAELPALTPTPAGSTRLLYLGRLEEEKGIRLLCAAFAEVVKSQPSLQLDVAGSGTLEASLRSQYAGLNNLHFCGSVAGAEKERLLNNCTALVVPSLVPEVFGRVIVEAYAHSRPVIAARTGGIPELVSPGLTGLLFQAGSQTELQAAIIELARNPAGWSMMNPNCRALAAAYSLEDITAQYLALYAGITA